MTVEERLEYLRGNLLAVDAFTCCISILISAVHSIQLNSQKIPKTHKNSQKLEMRAGVAFKRHRERNEMEIMRRAMPSDESTRSRSSFGENANEEDRRGLHREKQVRTFPHRHGGRKNNRTIINEPMLNQ